MIGIVSVGFRGSNDSKGGLLNKPRIARRESIAQDGENFLDFRKVFTGNVTTAIGSGSYSCALYIGGEKGRKLSKAPSPPSRTTAEGYSPEIFSKVCIRVSTEQHCDSDDTHAKSLLCQLNI